MLDFSVTNCLCHGHKVLFDKKLKLDHQKPLVIKLMVEVKVVTNLNRA